MGMTGKAMRCRLDRNLAAAGSDLTAPQFILLKHVDIEEGVNQQTLTDHMFLDKTTVTRFIDALEAKNLVVRVPDKADRRQNMIYLTNEAKKIIGPLMKVVERTEKEALQGIAAERVNVCKEVLKQIQRNLEL
jgi:DNA-binding MarR family transcriptional regulator